jgi:GNAT superfamily N-acetyltransferase
MECIRITKETLKWFEPLLEPPYPEQIARGQVYAVGAVADGTACGVLVFRLTDLLIDIEYIAVSGGYRRRGVGTAMLRFLCDFAGKTVTPVACTFAAPDKTDPVYLFFAENEEFSVSQEEWYICGVDIRSLNEVSLPQMKTPGSVMPFFDLPGPDRHSFWNTVHKAGRLYGDELKADECVPPLCLCTRGRDGVNAAVFTQKTGDNGLELSFAWCAGGAHPRLAVLLGGLLREIPKIQTEGRLTVTAVTPESAALVEKLLPGREIMAVFYTAAWDMIRR